MGMPLLQVPRGRLMAGAPVAFWIVVNVTLLFNRVTSEITPSSGLK